jgi:hypothetical protein
LPEVAANLDRIALPDQVLFDADSRPEFGPIARDVASGREVSAEVGGRRLTVVGLYRIGTSFGIDGSLICERPQFPPYLWKPEPRLDRYRALIQLRWKSIRTRRAMRSRESAPRRPEVWRKPVHRPEIDYWAG